MPKIDWKSNILGFIPKKDWLDIPMVFYSIEGEDETAGGTT